MQVAPLPDGLRHLPEQFSLADEYGIAPDLVEGVRRFVQSAWDGSMISGAMYGGGIPLGDAIRKSTVELDAAVMTYLNTVPAEMNKLYGGAFNIALFSHDIGKAFANLKNLAFDGMGPKDYDNIQAVLSKNETAWRKDPQKIEVYTIQQFFLRLMDFAKSLEQRTGRAFEAAAPEAINGSSPSKKTRSESTAASEERVVMNYQDERIVGDWEVSKPDWATLFGSDKMNDDDGDEDEDEDIWLTPRMAAKIHNQAIVVGDIMFDDDLSSKSSHPRLPKIARPFFQKSEVWRLAFRDCYFRIAMRLQKGLPPQPNCTGEEMAFHNIMDDVPDIEEHFEDNEDFQALPEYLNDDDYFTVRDRAIQDEDVLELFDPGDSGYDDSDDEDNSNVDNPILEPGSKASFMLGSGGAMMRTANLHPNTWFLAFRKDRFRDHV